MDLEQPRMPAPPALPPPRGACDAHSHVFGPYDRFPLTATSSYPPPDAPFEIHTEMRTTLGIDRAVIVQPAPYGTDASALADALERSGGSLRGVAVVEPDAADTILEKLHAAGVRGIRFVEMRVPGTGQRYAGSIGIDSLPLLAPRMAALGWHAEVWGSVTQCASAAEACADLGLDVVLDHLAGASTDTAVDDADFARVLARVRSGDATVKLTLCRYSVAVIDYDKARPIHDSLLSANPERLVWGTDFPYVRRGANAPDGGHLLDLLYSFVADDNLVRQILVDNPARLYDFE